MYYGTVLAFKKRQISVFRSNSDPIPCERLYPEAIDNGSHRSAGRYYGAHLSESSRDSDLLSLSSAGRFSANAEKFNSNFVKRVENAK